MTGCCKEKIICSIIRQFSISSPCATQMCEVIPSFWDLVCPESGGNCHLTALLTKREAVLFLLGCEAYSVDESQSHYTMTAQAKADSRSDSRTQAQATGSSQKILDAHGETIYKEKSDSTSIYNSLRIGRAKDDTDGSSFYRDDGRGFGYNKSQSFSFLRNRINREMVRGATTNGSEHSRRRDCNYEYSHNNTSGIGVHLIIVAGSFTGTGSEWRKYQKTTARDLERELGGNFADGKETDSATSTTRSEHRWEDTFLADIEWFEKETTVRFHNERFDSRRTANAHSDGAGNGMHEQKEEGTSASQGTSQTVGDSETLRTASRVSNLDAFAVMNSQRFANLQNLYDQLTEQIDRLRRRLRAQAKPYIDVIPCACSSACCCNMRSIGLEYLSNCRTSTCSSGPSVLRHPRIM